jgi:hypothetical protein
MRMLYHQSSQRLMECPLQATGFEPVVDDGFFLSAKLIRVREDEP